MPEGPDPCQLQLDAVAAAEVELTTALQTFADRVEALMECQMEHSGPAVPPPGQPMHPVSFENKKSRRLKAIRHGLEIIRLQQQLIRDELSFVAE